MAKQRDPYESVRSFSSSGRGRSGGRDPYAAIASYKPPKPSAEEEQKKREEEERKKKREQNKKQQKSPVKSLADLASTINKKSDELGEKFDIFGGVRKTTSAVKALTGHYDRWHAKLDKELAEKKITRKQYNETLEQIQKEIGWAGTKDKGAGDRLKKAAGVSIQTMSEVYPGTSAAKGATLTAKIGRGAAEGAIMGGAGSAGGQLVEKGNVSATQTLADMAFGGILGGGAPIVGNAAKKALKGVKSKIPGVRADEDVIRTQSMGDGKSPRSRADEAKKAFIDRTQPVKDLMNAVGEKLGRKISKDESAHELLKLRAGVEGQAVTHLNDTASWMKDVDPEIRQDGDDYNYAKQFLSQADKRTPEQIQTAKNTIAKLESKYGENIGVLDEYGTKTRETFDTIIDLYENEGIISKQHAANLRKNPDYFAKMEVIQDETEKFLRGGSVNTKRAEGLLGIKGQSKGAKIAPSAEAYVKQVQTALHDVANNKVGRSIGKLAEEMGDNDLIIKLRDTDNVLARQEIYSELKKTKELKNGLKTLSRDHKKAIRTLEAEIRKLKAKGQNVLASKSKEARDAVIKAANDGAKLPGNGSQVAKLPSGLEDVERILDEWIKSDKSGLKGLVDRLASKDQKMADLKTDLEAIEGSLSRVLTQRKDLWKKAQGLRDADLPKGYTRISYMENGVRNEVAVPKEVGDVLTGADAQAIDIATRTIGKVTNIFRQAVTTYNPLFVFFRNPARDFKSFMINSRYVPVRKAVTEFAKGMMDALTNSEWKKEFLRAGGGQAGYFSNEGGQAGKSIAKAAKEISGKRSLASRVVTSPRDFMQAASEVFEMAPRIAEYKNAVKSGASRQEAAIAGREVTVDFAQGGNVAKVVNQIVPFLNARAQGTRRTVQAFKENPKRALTVWAATGVAPMAALMAYNQSFFKDTWNDIQDYEKENNFIFITGPDSYIKFPKGDVDKILGNTFETMLDQFMGGNGSAAQKLMSSLVSAGSNFSPISFANNGQVSGSALLSSALPGPVKALAEDRAGEQGYSFFKDAPIVPDNLKGAPANEQVMENTPWLARTLGDLTNSSPLKAENTVKNLAGDLPFDLTRLAAGDVAGVAQRLKKGAVGEGPNKIETEFFKVYAPAKATKEYREKQFYKLIDQGKYKEAQRRVDEYNRDIDKRFEGYFKNYGASLPDQFDNGIDPYEMIDFLKLDVVVSKKGKPYIKR